MVRTNDQIALVGTKYILSSFVYGLFFYTEIHIKSLQNKYQAALKDIEHQKELLLTARKDAEEISKLSENFEKQFVAERETNAKYKREVKTKFVLFF